MDATCKTCPFFCPEGDNKARGFCQHDPPSNDDRAPMMWPEVLTADSHWCGEHPLRQRDRLAAMMLQGMLADPACTAPAACAPKAYEFADALLAEAAKERP